MSDLQDEWNRRHPDVANPRQITVQPVAAPKSDLQSDWDRRHPAPTSTATDADLATMMPWEKPSNVSWSDYALAGLRPTVAQAGQAVGDVGKAFADDYTYGFGTQAAGAASGDEKAWRDEAEAAKQRLGASRYSVATAAALAPNPLKWAALGTKAAKGVQGVVGPLAASYGPKVLAVAKQGAHRVGDAVEGAVYSAAQDIGHGARDAASIAKNAAANAVVSSGLGQVGELLPAAATWAKANAPWPFSKSWRAPEAPAADIPSKHTSPLDVENADQLNLWRSNAKYGNPPTQGQVSQYAGKQYGADMANWPEALRNLHEAAGEGGKKRWALDLGGQALGGAGQYALNSLGMGLDPATWLASQAGLGVLTHEVIPAFKNSLTAQPTARPLADAYPALTGWRPTVNPPPEGDWRTALSSVMGGMR